VTQKDAEFLARFTPSRLYIVLNHGVIFEEFWLPEREPECHTIAFVGNFAHYPNADAARFFVTEILPLVARQVPDVKFYLVGTDPANELARYRSHPQVVVTGKVNDVRPYIQNAAVCVAPLITGAGLRSKVIQYGALKRACVSTSIGVTDLVFEDGKDVLVADDPATFARGVVYLLLHPEASRRMAESACEKVKTDYDNRRLVAYLNEIYENLDRDSQRLGLQAT
jgi:glycosyltransferase involved in cell wall biosynthesis